VLTRLRARDFQSIRKADLELGKFTVVIGPTNSGKSALLRAIHLLAHNADSPSPFVAYGAKTTEVSIETGDGPPIGVELVRGKAKAEYRLTFDGQDVQSYPKAGKDVPADVAAVLRFTEVEGEDLNFAFQFDRPFLLSVPTTTAAKVLGDLTNVNRIFGAVREAARRRLEVQGKLKVRRTDLEHLHTAAQAYVGLPAQQKAVARARAAVQRAQDARRDAEAIEAFLAVVEAAERVLEALAERPVLPASVAISGIEDRVAELQRMAAIITIVEESERAAGAAKAEAASFEQQIVNLDVEYHGKLKEAGTCPVCGATIR
jgi:exonuclease SbcC